ncbi:hypothetical protein J6590_048995 [Homalodisca vitripennis]|nr:hypothetical protein J6590_048995 [Homalodisca vitripennis]
MMIDHQATPIIKLLLLPSVANIEDQDLLDKNPITAWEGSEVLQCTTTASYRLRGFSCGWKDAVLTAVLCGRSYSNQKMNRLLPNGHWCNHRVLYKQGYHVQAELEDNGAQLGTMLKAH